MTSDRPGPSQTCNAAPRRVVLQPGPTARQAGGAARGLLRGAHRGFSADPHPAARVRTLCVDCFWESPSTHTPHGAADRRCLIHQLWVNRSGDQPQPFGGLADQPKSSFPPVWFLPDAVLSKQRPGGVWVATCSGSPTLSLRKQ